MTGRGERRVRPLHFVALLSVALVPVAWTGWGALADVSAATTRYTEAVASKDSFIVDVFETVDGTTLFRSIAQRLVAGKNDDRARLAALVDWTIENVRPQYSAPDRVVSDNFLDVVRRGWGYCDQDAHVFAALATFVGYDAHVLFLRRSNGVSPHTVAEVRIGDRWILVDAWIGEVFTDDHGRMIGREDLRDDSQLTSAYALEIPGGLGIEDFRRGTVFETYPYSGIGGLLGKAKARLFKAPVAEVAPADARSANGGDATPMAPMRAEAPPAKDVLLVMDRARRAHLEGRYADAIPLYEGVIASASVELNESVRFFLGLAQFRAGDETGAIATFTDALERAPTSEWTPSYLSYRGQAEEAIGDLSDARRDYVAAGTPRALERLQHLN